VVAADDAHAQAFEQQVSQAVAGNSDVETHIRDLEHRIDAALAEGGGEAARGDLPPSDLVIEDLEDFLRRQRKNGEE
jgi:hypothetical protein